MSDLPASEFGGKTNRLGIQPPPHPLSAYEKLRAIYLSGDELERGDLPPQRNREAMQGLLPEAEQIALREEEGVLDKGQVWEEMLQAGEE
jgi:hypothetical protein